jgi:tRNA 2-selenouridine synthase
MADDARVALLLDEYAFFMRDVKGFCGLLDALVELQGRDVVRRWQTMAHAGQWADVYRELMLRHYDPLYNRSIRRNFDIDEALHLPIADGGEAAMAHAAQLLIAQSAAG